MIFGKPYSQPPATFQTGQLVRYQGKIYAVEGSTHTHSQLEGIRYAIPNWELKKARERVKRKPDKISSVELLIQKQTPEVYDRSTSRTQSQKALGAKSGTQDGSRP